MQILHNMVFFKSQNPHKAGTLCTFMPALNSIVHIAHIKCMWQMLVDTRLTIGLTDVQSTNSVTESPASLVYTQAFVF
jgi:hypothetical protein